MGYKTEINKAIIQSIIQTYNKTFSIPKTTKIINKYSPDIIRRVLLENNIKLVGKHRVRVTRAQALANRRKKFDFDRIKNRKPPKDSDRRIKVKDKKVEEVIIKLYLETLSVPKVVIITGYSESIITRILKLRGIKLIGLKIRKKTVEEKKLRAKRYYKQREAYFKKKRKEYESANSVKIRVTARKHWKKKYLKLSQNPEFVIRKNLRNRLWYALRDYTKNGKIMSSTKYGINYASIIEHLKPFPEDISKYHIDHIRPLCSFQFTNKDGSTNLTEIKKAFAPENHQWLLAEENLKKNKHYNETSDMT